jgi:vancomycin resistance protein YoaR
MIKAKKHFFIIMAVFVFGTSFVLFNYNKEKDVLVNINAEENKISEYTTKFNTKSFGRAENIRLAAKAINEKEILPGETFSYNKAVGPTNKQNGYKLSYIFINGKKKKGYGGGVCQVSSTLYNALLGADLNVTERHAHTGDVHYVPNDKDAATSYGGLDLKFINNKDYAIKIISYVYNNTVTVAIYKSA